MINSIPLDKPIEVLNITSINPLVSKCDIKVCYVQDEPNRNKSIITKEMGKKLAASLPGSPIVGHYNRQEKDFEEHNRILEFVDGKLTLSRDTQPYGFCDVNAPVWFQWFNDDGVDHEYLMTQGYLWTGQYAEAQGVIDNGNNQSMELNQKSVKGSWTKDSNGLPQFFIINEAIIENLCILGRDVPPCFEGAQITPATEFALTDSFKNELYSLMEQMKKILNKGGTPVFTTYAVEIGDSLWSAMYEYIRKQYPDPQDQWSSMYRVDGIFEEDNQKFAVLQDRSSLKYYRLDFSVDEANGFVPAESLVEVTATYVPAETAQFSEEAVSAYAASLREEAEKDPEPAPADPEPEENPADPEPKPEEDPADPELAPADPEPEEPEGEPAPAYKLDEIPEYVELQTQFADLSAQVTKLNEQIAALTTANVELTAFKAGIEKTEKEALINKFYMLSDDDKKDCIEHIDTYSLDDIEAKLSIICVRKRVSFDLDPENNDKGTTFNLGSINPSEDPSMPAWVRAVKEVAKNGNI